MEASVQPARWQQYQQNSLKKNGCNGPHWKIAKMAVLNPSLEKKNKQLEPSSINHWCWWNEISLLTNHNKPRNQLVNQSVPMVRTSGRSQAACSTSYRVDPGWSLPRKVETMEVWPYVFFTITVYPEVHWNQEKSRYDSKERTRFRLIRCWLWKWDWHALTTSVVHWAFQRGELNWRAPKHPTH